MVLYYPFNIVLRVAALGFSILYSILYRCTLPSQSIDQPIRSANVQSQEFSAFYVDSVYTNGFRVDKVQEFVSELQPGRNPNLTQI